MKDIDDLLNKSIPAYRKAYSDRSCWLMACLSELAYIKFNPLLATATAKKYFVKQIEALIDDSRIKSLEKLVALIQYDANKEKEKLIKEVQSLRLELLQTFDCNGTQAILVKSIDDFLILAFRGTEASSIKDIKADCDARLITCDSGGKVHQGFEQAYAQVACEIENALAQYEQQLPLFITGHSLGGALATLAAKKLRYKKIAACYTFGAPRAGNETWISNIKTPIYRIVNSADCVTMVPPNGSVIDIVAVVVGFFSSAAKKYVLHNFAGFSHGGNMRYLTNCAPGSYADVQLLYSVDLLRRCIGWYKKQLSFSKIMSDHSIAVYRKKLTVVARNRNPCTAGSSD